MWYVLRVNVYMCGRHEQNNKWVFILTPSQHLLQSVEASSEIKKKQIVWFLDEFWMPNLPIGHAEKISVVKLLGPLLSVYLCGCVSVCVFQRWALAEHPQIFIQFVLLHVYILYFFCATSYFSGIQTLYFMYVNGMSVEDRITPHAQHMQCYLFKN